MKSKLHYLAACALILVLSACSNSLERTSRHEKIKVPIAINIRTDNSPGATDLHPYLYQLKIKEFLDHYRNIDLVLVENDENADVVLDIDIENFYISPTKESTATKNFKRMVQVGTDANGKPVFQQVTASIYQETHEITSSTRLKSSFNFKDSSFRVQAQKYNDRYVWRHVGQSVDGNVQVFGLRSDSNRSYLVEEPLPEELLFKLSGEMLGRVSYDLRKYYQKLNY